VINDFHLSTFVEANETQTQHSHKEAKQAAEEHAGNEGQEHVSNTEANAGESISQS